jgi:hypothetical protein
VLSGLSERDVWDMALGAMDDEHAAFHYVDELLATYYIVVTILSTSTLISAFVSKRFS